MTSPSPIFWFLGGALVLAGGAGAFTLGTSGVSRLAQAIAKAEGFGVPNAIPTRANNPGDLKVPGGTPLSGTSITAFATVADGWAALERQLMFIVNGTSKNYNLDMTIAQMGDVWAPPSENAAGVWAKNVAAALGVPTSTTLRSILV